MVVYPCNGIVLSSEKEQTVWLCAVTWLNLRIILLSEGNQTKKVRLVSSDLYSISFNLHIVLFVVILSWVRSPVQTYKLVHFPFVQWAIGQFGLAINLLKRPKQ